MVKIVCTVLKALTHEIEPVFNESFNKPSCNLLFTSIKLSYCKKLFLDEKFDKRIKKEVDSRVFKVFTFIWLKISKIPEESLC